MLKNYLKVVLSLFSISIFTQGCKEIEMTSQWNQHDIEIDGIDLEWSGSYKFLEDEKAVIGARNDSTYLYLVFKTVDNQTMQKIIGNGLTLWIDPSGEEEKSFGIQYPIGMMDWNKSQLYDPVDWGTPDEREKRLKEKSKIMLNELEIITPVGRSQHKYSMSNPYGIELAIKDTIGTLVYELKIPLTQPIGSMYDLNLITGSKVNIGIETGEIDRQSMMDKKSLGGGMPGGGREGGMMGKGSGKGRGNQSAMKNMLEPIKFWISLTLSTQNAESIENTNNKQ